MRIEEKEFCFRKIIGNCPENGHWANCFPAPGTFSSGSSSPGHIFPAHFPGTELLFSCRAHCHLTLRVIAVAVTVSLPPVVQPSCRSICRVTVLSPPHSIRKRVRTHLEPAHSVVGSNGASRRRGTPLASPRAA